MKTVKYVSLMLMVFLLILGCSGNYGKVRPQSKSESKATSRELIDNWSDYNIWLRCYRPGLAVVVFDPKNDDRKILVDSRWDTVKDQKDWTKIVKENTTSEGDFRMVWSGRDNTTGVIEIWGSNNQLYGFIIYQQDVTEWVNLRMVSENTMRLSWERSTWLQKPPPRGGLDSFI